MTLESEGAIWGQQKLSSVILRDFVFQCVLLDSLSSRSKGSVAAPLAAKEERNIGTGFGLGGASFEVANTGRLALTVARTKREMGIYCNLYVRAIPISLGFCPSYFAVFSPSSMYLAPDAPVAIHAA